MDLLLHLHGTDLLGLVGGVFLIGWLVCFEYFLL